MTKEQNHGMHLHTYLNYGGTCEQAFRFYEQHLGGKITTERVHALLAEGGEIFMPMAETFYATRFSMLRDKFGTSWMILHPKPQVG